MKRMLAVFAALLMLLLVSCRPESDGAASDPSWRQVAAEKKLYVGVDVTALPMAFETGRELTGFDVDLAREVCKRLNLSLELVPVATDNAQQALEEGAIDCMWSGYYFDIRRDEQLTLSDAYLSVSQVLVVRQDAAYQNIADLTGAVLGVRTGSRSEETVRGTEQFSASLQEIAVFESTETLIDALVNGTVQAAAMDETAARYYMLQGQPVRMIEAAPGAPEDLSTGKMVVAFSWGSDALCAKVQEALSTMVRDEVFEQLSQKWFGVAMETGISA